MMPSDSSWRQFKDETGKRRYSLVSLKNDKWRRITPADFVMELLRRQWSRQAGWRLRAGPAWEDSGLVFTNELGKHLSPYTVYHNFKRLAASIGLPEARVHDLRHPNVKPKTQIFLHKINLHFAALVIFYCPQYYVVLRYDRALLIDAIFLQIEIALMYRLL